MAKKVKTKKEKDIDILDYKIAQEEALIANWEKYGIAQNKIDKLKAKKDKHKNKKTEIESE